MSPGKFWREKIRAVRNLERFRCDGSSRHFDINYGVWRNGTEKFIAEIEIAHAFIEPFTWKLRIDPFSDSAVGLPPNYRGMTLTAIHNARVLAEIAERFSNASELRLLEIGGGFGGFARSFLVEWPKARLFLVDFPEMLDLQCSYLRRHRLSEWYRIPAGTPWPEDVVVDAVVNMTSMCEMDLAEVHFYREQMERVLRPDGFLVSVNHIHCQNDRADWGFEEPGWGMLYDEPFSHMPEKRGNLTVWQRIATTTDQGTVK